MELNPFIYIMEVVRGLEHRQQEIIRLYIWSEAKDLWYGNRLSEMKPTEYLDWKAF